MGLTGAVIIAVVLLLAFSCGGYVAGRMARVNGLKQGIAVWVWTIVIGVVVALALGLLGGLAGMRSHRNVDQVTPDTDVGRTPAPGGRSSYDSLANPGRPGISPVIPGIPDHQGRQANQGVAPDRGLNTTATPGSGPAASSDVKPWTSSSRSTSLTAPKLSALVYSRRRSSAT